MKKVEIPKKWLGLMIGLCVFSLVAAMIEYQRYKPAGWAIESSDIQDKQAVADPAEPAQANSADPADQNTIDSSGGNVNSQATGKVIQIPVYLVGAVKHPGIYQVNRGSYLYELIEQAGGLREDAAAEEINLAQKITENIHIRVPTIDEFREHPGFAWTDGREEQGQSMVNLNQATVDELDALPGIGPATAKAIVDFRERNGPFATREDLMKVAGIKQSRFDTIADMIEVG